MRLIQATLGGLVGAALGAGIYFFVTQSLTRPMPWAALIIGLMSGLGVRLICRGNRSAATGIIAAALALLALLGCNLRQIATATTATAPTISAMAANNYDDEDGDTTDEDGDTTDEDGDTTNEDGDTTDEDDAADEDGDTTDGDDVADDGENPIGDETDERDQEEAADGERHEVAPPMPRTSTPVKSVDSHDVGARSVRDAMSGPVGMSDFVTKDGIALILSGLLAYLLGRGDSSAATRESKPGAQPAV